MIPLLRHHHIDPSTTTETLKTEQSEEDEKNIFYDVTMRFNCRKKNLHVCERQD